MATLSRTPLAIVSLLYSLLASNGLAKDKPAAESTKPPAVGETAPDFELKTLDGTAVKLTETLKTKSAVILVLRGWPGYQCPLCSRQVGQFIVADKMFPADSTNVILIYPGPEKNLSKFAKEFIKGNNLPKNYHFVTDPGYKFTNGWNLRWDAPRETAYPSTFVVGTDGKVKYALVSEGHAGRSNPKDVAAALKK